MNALSKQTEYLYWLESKVPCDFGHISYSKLMQTLFDREFTYTLEMDENRAIQGASLRQEYADEHCLDDYWMSQYPCTVLEMMVALARISEERTMCDENYGNRTGKWFWDMLASVGVLNMDDDHYNSRYVDEKIQAMLDRDYSPNGQGGLFTIANAAVDLRTVDIWYQAQWYFASCLHQKPLQLTNRKE